MERPRNFAFLPLILLLALATTMRASDLLDSDVLNQVPRDALGLVVVRNLSQADAKAGKLLGAIGSRLPGPLALLKSIAGLDAGLDQGRDLLVVLLPPQNNSRQFHLAVWLPVRDYDALVRSLDGDPQRRIAAVTLAGEDLLVVRQSNWAVIMDTDQRDRLEQLRDGKASPPAQLAKWSTWTAQNDAAIVALPAGMRTAWALAAEEGLFDATPATAQPQPQNNDDLFGPANVSRPPTQGWPAVRHWIRSTIAQTPELARWAAEAESVACGLQLDEEGNVLVGLRAAVAQDAIQPAESQIPSGDAKRPPGLYAGGPFVITGSGEISPRWSLPAVAPYVRQQTNGLTAQFGSHISAEDLARLTKGVEDAAADVSAFTVLTRPGAQGEGVYTNNFLALRVASAETFLKLADSLVEMWNTMVGKNDALKPLVFTDAEVKVAGHAGHEYAIDMTAAAGGPPIPEIKASMEKLFGPGGKFRLQFVAVDDRTVLLAAATEAQAADAIALMAASSTTAPEPVELRAAARMLSDKSQWQLFVSPSGYTEWMRRQLDAILGAVIGGPVVPQFPRSSPIALAGGVDGRILWTEMAVPVETLRGYAKFSRK